MTNQPGRLYLHVHYWDKRKGSQEKISFVIATFEDYKPIVRSLRSKRLKITKITISHSFDQEKKSE